MAELRAKMMVKEEALSLGTKKLHRRISVEEFNERWMNLRLCMFCGEQETPDHHLQHKNEVIRMIGFDEEQICKEEELPEIETEVATDPIETEHGTVSLVPEAQEEKSTSQFQVPIANSEIVRSIEPGKVDLGLEKLEHVVINENVAQDWVQKTVKVRFEADGDVEKDQKVTSNTNICCAHKVFGRMSQHQEILGIKKKKKGFKSRMFKYKKGNKKHDLLLVNGKDSLALRAIRTRLETVETDSSNPEGSKLCTEDKGELEGCLERLQASVLMKEESESTIVNEVKVETQTIDKGISTLLRGQSKRSTIIEPLVTMDSVVKPKEISYSHCIAQFHTMLLRLQSKRKQRKDHKSWMFKYKFDEEDQRNFRSRTRWTQEVPDVICFLLRRHSHLHLDCEEPELTGRKKNHGLFIRLHNKLKQQRCPKSWMFKFKTDYKPARINHTLHQKKKPKSFLEIEVLQEDVQHVPFAFLHMNANETRYAVRKPANQEPAISATQGPVISATQEPAIHQLAISANSGTQEPAIFQPDDALGTITRGKDGVVNPHPRYMLLADQRIWKKETHDAEIIDAYSVLQEKFEQVVNHTPFSVVKLERPQDHDALQLLLPGDERFQIKHKWRFKLLELELYLDSLVLITSYAHQFDIISLIILMRVELSVFFSTKPDGFFFSTNLEVKVSLKGEDVIQDRRKRRGHVWHVRKKQMVGHVGAADWLTKEELDRELSYKAE